MLADQSPKISNDGWLQLASLPDHGVDPIIERWRRRRWSCSDDLSVVNRHRTKFVRARRPSFLYGTHFTPGTQEDYFLLCALSAAVCISVKPRMTVDHGGLPFLTSVGVRQFTVDSW